MGSGQNPVQQLACRPRVAGGCLRPGQQSYQDRLAGAAGERRLGPDHGLNEGVVGKRMLEGTNLGSDVDTAR